MSTTSDLLFHLGGVPVDLRAQIIPYIGRGGHAYFVDPLQGSDSGGGLTLDDPLSSLGEAHDRMTANQNDVAFVLGHSSATYSVREAAQLAWSKSLCHIVGLGPRSMFAHRTSIRATAGVDIATFVSVTASGCEFHNFHVFHGYATNEAQIAWQDAGDRNSYYNVHLGGMGAQLAADHASSASLKLYGGGERVFKDCVIGLDTVTRGAANASVIMAKNASSVACTRDSFINCRFPVHADASTPVIVRASASGDLDRTVLFDRCIFENALGSASTTLAEAFDVHATVGGTILLRDPVMIGITDFETAAVSGNVMILGPVPTAATSGLAVDVA